MEWAECQEYKALIKWGLKRLPDGETTLIPPPPREGSTDENSRSLLRSGFQVERRRLRIYTSSYHTWRGPPSVWPMGRRAPRPAAAPFGARRPAQIHNLLNTGIDWGAAGPWWGKRTRCPISWTSVSILFLSDLYALSHTDTQTRTCCHACVGCRERKTARRKTAHLWLVNTAPPPVWYASYMHNIRLQYNTRVQRNIWF